MRSAQWILQAPTDSATSGAGDDAQLSVIGWDANAAPLGKATEGEH